MNDRQLEQEILQEKNKILETNSLFHHDVSMQQILNARFISVSTELMNQAWMLSDKWEVILWAMKKKLKKRTGRKTIAPVPAAILYLIPVVAM